MKFRTEGDQTGREANRNIQMDSPVIKDRTEPVGRQRSEQH